MKQVASVSAYSQEIKLLGLVVLFQWMIPMNPSGRATLQAETFKPLLPVHSFLVEGFTLKSADSRGTITKRQTLISMPYPLPLLTLSCSTVMPCAAPSRKTPAKQTTHLSYDSLETEQTH